MSAKTSELTFKKGSPEQREMEKQIKSFLSLKGFKNLKDACNKTGSDYQLIYGQLSGYRACKVADMEYFVKAIDPNKKIEIKTSKTIVLVVDVPENEKE